MNVRRVLISFMTVGSLFVSTAFAQDVQKKERKQFSVEERAQMKTDRMKEKLSLTDEQAKSVYEINLKYAKSHTEMRVKDKEVKQAKKEAWKASKTQQDAELKSVLNDEQYAKMQEQRKEQMQKHKAKKWCKTKDKSENKG